MQISCHCNDLGKIKMEAMGMTWGREKVFLWPLSLYHEKMKYLFIYITKNE